MKVIMRVGMAVLMMAAMMMAQSAASNATIPQNTKVFEIAANENVTITGTASVSATTQTTANGVQIQLGSQSQGSGTGSTTGNTYHLSGRDNVTTTVPSLPATVRVLSKAMLTATDGQSQNVVIVLQVNMDAQGNTVATVQSVQPNAI